MEKMENQKFRPGGKDYIIVNDEKKLKIDEVYIEKLKKQAKESNHSKFTVCLHNDVRAHVHEMIQIYRKHEYVRPHYHPQKTETKIILEGKLLVVIYDMAGQELERFVMSRDKGSVFTFRMDKGIIHTNIPLTDVVFHEIIAGPYIGVNDSIFPDWACGNDDAEGIKKFMDDLLYRDERGGL